MTNAKRNIIRGPMFKVWLLHFVLIVPFLYLTYQSVSRYFLFQIAVAITAIEMENKPFPSISICTQYAQKHMFRGSCYKYPYTHF